MTLKSRLLPSPELVMLEGGVGTQSANLAFSYAHTCVFLILIHAFKSNLETSNEQIYVSIFIKSIYPSCCCVAVL